MKVQPHLGREIEIEELPEQVAYATYHPSDIRNLSKPAVSIQRNKQIVLDVKKCLEETLEKPVEASMVNHELVVGFDTEFMPETGEVITVSLSDCDTYSIDDKEDIDGGLRRVPTRMQMPAILAAHFAHVDIDSLCTLDSTTPAWLKGENLRCTFILAHMQNENLPQKYHYGVEDVLCRLYRAPNWKDETEVVNPADPTSWGLEKRKRRCGYDAWAALKIYQHPLIQQVVKDSPFVVHWQHRMMMTYHRMKYTGMIIDKRVFEEMRQEMVPQEEALRKSLEAEILDRYYIPEFQLSNNNALRELIYKHMKMPQIKKSQSGLWSVDADALEDMKSEPLIGKILEWRHMSKILTQWYGVNARPSSIPLQERVTWSGDLGHIPVNLGVGQTATLRRQSNSPNVQNWTKKVRKAVTSRFGKEGRLIWSDYEKLEVFLLADEIKCEKLKDYFMNKGGYLGIGSQLMGMNITKESDHYRATKATVLAANYYAKPMTIANQLFYKAGVRYSQDFAEVKWKSEHYRKSKQLLERYYMMFPKIPAWFEEVRRELLKNQGVTNRFGHIRHLPCPNGDNTPGFNRLLTQAINFKIQSVAGLVTGIAAVAIEDYIVDKYLNDEWQTYHKHLMDVYYAKDISQYKKVPYLYNEVHDELDIDCPLEYIDEMKQSIEILMTSYVKKVLQQQDSTFDAHLAVEMSVGEHWYV